jgi:hypothetical protein
MASVLNFAMKTNGRAKLDSRTGGRYQDIDRARMRRLSPLVEIRLQLAAITLADELTFTRAADRLNITQPALSN